MKETKKLRIGYTAEKEPLYRSVEELSSFLIGGFTGTGKSVFLENLLHQVLRQYGPEDAKVVLIDPKTTEFYYYTEIPHLLVPVIKKCSVAVRLLKKLMSETREYPVFVFLDEYMDWVYRKRFIRQVMRVAKAGKKRGVYLFVASQVICPEFLPENFPTSFDNVAASYTTSDVPSLFLLGEPAATQLARHGEMLLWEKASGKKTKITFLMYDFD